MRYWYKGRLIKPSFHDECKIPVKEFAIKVSYLPCYSDHLKYLNGDTDERVRNNHKLFELQHSFFTL